MDAMAQYDGSIIVVSHNRFFLDHFTNKTLEIKDGKSTLYEGNISYYISKTQDQRKHASAPTTPQQAPKASTQKPSAGKGKKARQEQARLRQQQNKVLAPLKKTAADNEKLVEKLEKEKGKIEQILADPELYQDQTKFMEKSKEYADLERRLERAYNTWEDAQEKLEKASLELDEK